LRRHGIEHRTRLGQILIKRRLAGRRRVVGATAKAGRNQGKPASKARGIRPDHRDFPQGDGSNSAVGKVSEA
jgi:hypothetical protein